MCFRKRRKSDGCLHMFENNKIIGVVLVLLSIVVLGFFFIASSLYPMCQDDYLYKYVFNQNELVNNLSDVFRSQKNHWFLFNGRFVAHCLVQIFLMFERIWFCFANCMCYAVCCGCIVKIVSRQNFVRNFLLVMLSLWLVLPTPGATCFWLTGSFNYLWAMCATTIFLYLLFSDSRILHIIAIPAGIIVGNWHESIALATSCALLGYCVLSPKKSVYFYAAVFTYMCGALTNIVAPGNYVRLDNAYMPSYSENVLCDYLLKYSRNVAKLLYRLLLNWSEIGIQIAVIMWCVAACFCVRLWKNKEKSFILPLCLIVGALFSTALNVASGVTYARTLCGFCFYSYFAFLFYFFRNERQNKWRLYLVVAVVVNVICMPYACERINIYRLTMQNVVNDCAKGRCVVKAHAEQEKAGKSRFSDAKTYSCTLETPFMTRFLKVKELTILNETEFNIITKYKEELKNMPLHEARQLEKFLYVARFEQRPQVVESSITYKHGVIDGKPLLQKVQHWVDSQRNPGKQCYVIYVDGAYYAYWYKTDEQDARIAVCYRDGRTVAISSSNRSVMSH